MNRVFNILKLELNKPKNIRNLFITIVVFLIVSCFTNYISNIPSNFLGYMPYVIIISSFYILGVEFESKTDKIVFSSKYTRTEILISKLVSVLIKSIIVAIIFLVVNYAINIYLKVPISNILTIKQIVNIFASTILYAFTMTCIIFLVTLVTKNGKATGVIMYILFFDLMNSLLANALGSSSISKTTAYLIENTPFYAANMGVKNGYYSLTQVVFMLAFGIVAFLASNIFLNRKSI